MCVGSEFQVDDAETENAWEVKLLIMPEGLTKRYVFEERKLWTEGSGWLVRSCSFTCSTVPLQNVGKSAEQAFCWPDTLPVNGVKTLKETESTDSIPLTGLILSSSTTELLTASDGGQSSGSSNDCTVRTHITSNSFRTMNYFLEHYDRISTAAQLSYFFHHQMPLVVQWWMKRGWDQSVESRQQSSQQEADFFTMQTTSLMPHQ